MKKIDDIKESLKRSRGTTYELFSLNNLANLSIVRLSLSLVV